MGKFKPYSTEQGELLPMYLGDWVPEDHLARSVHDIVDQLELSKLAMKFSDRGGEAYHPALLLKVLFYGYATGIFTSRKLEKAINENIPFRWLAGQQRPNHRTISDFRKNNLDVLPELFGQIVRIAQELGFVTLGHVSIDGSKIKANASKHKAMTRKRMKQEIARLEREIKETLNRAQKDDDQADQKDETESVMNDIQDRQRRLEKIRTALGQLEERKPEATSSNAAKDQANFTDDDSRIMNTKNQGVIQGYNPQIAVDQSHGIIVGTKVSNNPSDQQQFDDMLGEVKKHARAVPKLTTADAGYFSAANIQSAERYQTDAYIAATKEGKKPKNPYDKTNFTYDPDQDVYICPAGKLVERKQTVHADNDDKPTTWIYECQACPECPFQDQCVKAKSGKRTITRTEHDPIREAMRTKVQSEKGKAIYKQRKSIVEPDWGEMKEWQGFRQFHLRGEEKVEGEMLLLAMSCNLRKIHSAKFPKKVPDKQRETSVQKRKNAA